MRLIVSRLRSTPRTLWASLHAFRWTRTELRDVKARLANYGVTVRANKPPPELAPRGHRGLHAALRMTSPTCLERALVLQSWCARYSQPPQVVVGVRRGETAFEAHAWVDGVETDTWFDESYDEITRLDFES